MVVRGPLEISEIPDSVSSIGLHLFCVTQDSRRPQLLLARLGGLGRSPTETQFCRSSDQVLTGISCQHFRLHVPKMEHLILASQLAASLGFTVSDHCSGSSTCITFVPPLLCSLYLKCHQDFKDSLKQAQALCDCLLPGNRC